MATLYVENVPTDLYEALRQRARDNRRSIAAEVLSLLEDNVVTERELQGRRQLLRKIERLHSKKQSRKVFPSTEEMQREDRAR
jgi:plasmid stability protein